SSSRSTSLNATALRHLPDRVPVLPRIDTRTACWPAVSRHWVRFSRASSETLAKPGLSRWGSHRTSVTSVQMLVACRNGISAFGLWVVCAWRAVSESVRRRRAMAVSNIKLRPGCRVTEIVPSHGAARARGVRFDAAAGQTETLEADLVVDASGRGALTVALLD